MTMQKNKISIIVLTYNKLKEATKQFLDYLYQDNQDFELIIIDNGSTDGTVEFLRKFEQEHDNVKVIYNCENLGYSKGCNQGIKVAKGDIIGLLNNDILFSSDWLKHIEDFFEKEPDAGFVSPHMIERSIYSRQKFKKITKKPINKLAYDTSIKPSFSCVFSKKQLFDKIGLFDENFTPAYFEDDDICWRAIFAYYKNYELKNVYFYHLGSLTGKSLSNLNQLFKRNQEYYFQKYADKPFVECYWKDINKYVQLKNKILKYKFLLSLVGLKTIWKKI